MNLQGATVVVTGGGSGLGEATARRLAGCGRGRLRHRPGSGRRRHPSPRGGVCQRGRDRRSRPVGRVHLVRQAARSDPRRGALRGSRR